MKKLIAFIIAFVLLLIVLIVVILDADFGKNRCESESSAGGSAPAVINGDFAYPTDPDATTLTSPFGPRWGTFHDGVDLAGPVGTPLFAFADGRVLDARDTGVQGFGGWVVLEHNIDGRQIQTVYGHQDPGGNRVQAGDLVKKGQHIADMGNSGFSTGPHLHFEIVEGDRAAGGQKVDPWPWIEPVLNGERTEQNDDSDGDERETPARDNTTVQEVQGVAGLNGRQTALAKQIVAIGEALGVDRKGRVIAVATAKHESQLKVYANDGVILPYELSGMPPGTTAEELQTSLEYPHDAVGTDHASVGTFQQQVGYWGSVEELMNPAINAKKFYEKLVQIDYQSMEIGVAASRVQGNATGTGVYQAEAGIAEQLVDTFEGAGDELSADEIEALGTSSIGSSALSDCNTVGGSSTSGGGSVTGSASGMAIVNAARTQSGHPYVWGGGDINGPTGGGFDCSGLVLYAVYQASGGAITLPHNSAMQRKDPHIREVAWEDRQPGDLIFVGQPGNEHHVAIYSGQKDGQDMWIEAQTYGVPSGEYPVRFGEPLSVGRVAK